MEKTNKKHLKLTMLLCIVCCTVFSQGKSGVENYNLIKKGTEYVWMPIFHIQTNNGIYSEVRYNYEDLNTVSVYGGKTFEGPKNLPFSLTPMLGISFGQFSGLSAAVNGEFEWRKIYFSTQTQYSVATKKDLKDFAFSWTELGINLSKRIYTGFAIQYTLQDKAQITEPGFVAGIVFENFSIPIYFFSPFQPGRNFILGLNYEFQFKNSNR